MIPNIKKCKWFKRLIINYDQKKTRTVTHLAFIKQSIKYWMYKKVKLKKKGLWLGEYKSSSSQQPLTGNFVFQSDPRSLPDFYSISHLDHLEERPDIVSLPIFSSIDWWSWVGRSYRVNNNNKCQGGVAPAWSADQFKQTIIVKDYTERHNRSIECDRRVIRWEDQVVKQDLYKKFIGNFHWSLFLLYLISHHLAIINIDRVSFLLL